MAIQGVDYVLQTCDNFYCQEWVEGEQVRPSLVKRGNFWCCPKCCRSYGAEPDSYSVPE